MGCAGRVANGINTVHVSLVREKTGHALIGARQRIAREQIEDPVTSLVMGLPPDLGFRTKGQLAMDICADCYAGGLSFEFACGDEVYGSCTRLREFFEEQEQAYVLRVAPDFTLVLAPGAKVTCAEAVKRPLRDKRRREVRSAGQGPRGGRWYAWAWIATASPRHHLLVRRHLKTGELAFHYCYVAEGQLLSKTRLIRAAGLRWPVGGGFQDREGQPRPGPVPGPALHRDPASHRAGHGRPGDLRRHSRLAQGPHRCPGPAARDARQAPPSDPGMIPLTVPETKRLLAAVLTRRHPRGHTACWLAWRRRHQARSRWFHQRTRLSREYTLVN